MEWRLVYGMETVVYGMETVVHGVETSAWSGD